MSNRIYPADKVNAEIAKRGYTHTYAVQFQVLTPVGWHHKTAYYIANSAKQPHNVERFWRWQFAKSGRIRLVSIKNVNLQHG